MHQYIDYVVYFNRIDSHYHPNEHTILYVFRAPGYDLLCIIKLIQILISERVQISNYLTPPPERYTTMITCLIPVRLAGKSEGEGLWTYYQLCILIQVLV